MTRRILFMLLAFTAIVLVGAVVPLTLNATSHDRNSFTAATEDMDRADAAIAQARLDGAPTDGPLIVLIDQVKQAGDGLLILKGNCALPEVSGQPLPCQPFVNTNMPVGNWKQLAKDADAQAQTVGKPNEPVQPIPVIDGSRVISAVAVITQGEPHGPVVGTVILARPTNSLNNEIVALWVILGSVAAVAMIAAALLAFGLARWVSRPLKGLDSAARRLADGDLAIRAKVGSGPPELRRLGTTFNTMAGRLEALVHGNRAVIADVSHQLRTPLAALRLRLDLLAADTSHSDPETAHELAGALDELARLSRLVDGLLTVARAENVVPVPTAVDVAEVARERVVAWHPVADDRSIVLIATAAGPGSGLGSALGVGRSAGAPVLAWIGEGHLEQILDNLIANALEALSPGNIVRLTTSATAAGVQITVADNGPGMSAEDRERAFLRFTTSSPNGTGLGLAIVHRLATSNGGTARLDETPGGGLTVTLDFPRAPAPNSSAPSSTSAHDAISM
ncbi:MAG TPA: HAMP domain-containing sensor histidine kinase [Streptosporangiaceae bacterium]|nr:HAMP domain-containing sensor histidine kinase [Streptosporangiaceae bacterium]